MRILVLGNLLFARELQDLGQDVKTCAFGPQMKTGIFGPEVRHSQFGTATDVELTSAPVGITQVLKELAPWTPEAILLGDGSTFPLFPGLEFMPVPLVWFAMDAHIHARWHTHYAPVFDLIFVAQQDYLSYYQSDPSRQRVRWLPLFANGAYDRCLQLPRQQDLAFVGTMDPQLNPQRVRFIEQIQAQLPVHVTQGAYLEPYNRARLVLNQSVEGEVNFRIFEAMACGAAVLTERIGNGLDTLFQEGTDVVLYERNSPEDAARQAQRILAQPERCQEIARAGMAKVVRHHTSAERAGQILSALHEMTPQETIQRRGESLADIEAHMVQVYDHAAKVHRHHAQQQPDAQHLMRAVAVYTGMAEAMRNRFNLAPPPNSTSSENSLNINDRYSPTVDPYPPYAD
ncbi:MAG: glycosyltransferase family 1 protein [Magnetococcales bacterium]|nr:glycosyltransferase family 1 protein [Magnetococcales bacterium]